MQMVKKTLLIMLIGWLALLFFMPKAELYYGVEKALAKKDIRLNENSINEGIFSLHVTGITIYVKGIALAQIEELHFFTLLFYSKLDIYDLLVDEALHKQVPPHTKRLRLKHTLLNPVNLTLDANGSFGTAEGNINLLDRQIDIAFPQTKDISMMQPYLNKGEKGWIYEKSF